MQDIFNVFTFYNDGKVEANFSRSLNTGDGEDDLDLLNECQHFIYLYPGGDLESGSDQIRKHTETPISSSSMV